MRYWFAKLIGWKTTYHVSAISGTAYMDGAFTACPWVSDSNFHELRDAVKKQFGDAISANSSPTILSVTKIGPSP